MKKRILTFLTLLVAFFGLIGLTTNNYAVINAAGNDASVEYDANVAISNVPDSAILSFPLTYESVYGNTITWSVNDNEFIKYELEAQWMVVYRSLEQDGSATVTVTVTNGTTTVTKTKEVSVPKGYTSAPMYSITYELDGGTLEEQKTEYKLGDPSYELPTPTKQGHVFLGWYDENDDKVETILVGSMKNYNLTAKWEARAVKSIEITKAPDKVNYKGGETIDLTGIEVTAHYNDGTTEAGVTVTAKEKVNYGEEEVEVTYKVGEQEFKASYAITVVKNTFEVTFNGDTVTYDGEAHSIYASVATLPTAITVTYEGNGQVDANEEGYTVTAKFSWNESDQNYEFYHTNYELPADLSATLIIEKADYDLSGITFEGKEVTYDGETHSIAVAGLPEGLTAKYDKTPELKDAGSIEVTATLENSNSNYNDVENTYTATLTVNKAPITLTTSNQTITLSQVNDINWEYEGIVDGITVTPKYYDGENEIEVANLIAGKTYTVKFMVESSNYEVTLDDATLTISSEEVNFKVEGTYTYNGELQTLVVKAYDKEDNEIQGTIKYDGKESYQQTKAGEYQVEVTLVRNQYVDVTSTVTFVIAKKAATLTVTNTSSVYGQNPVFAYTQEGILANDISGLSINFESLANETADAGSYEVSLTYTANANYNITVEKGTHTITPKAATLTVTNTSSVYGQNPVFAYTPEGILENDIYGLSINFESLANETADAGSYEVSLTYTANANYNITVEKGTHTITPKELINNDVTISVLGSDYNAQKADTLTPSVKVMYGQTEITSYTLAYAYANETTKVGTATITITLNGNYEGTLTATFEVTEYGQAKVLAEELEAENGYKTTLTGEVESIDQLVTSYEGATIKWISTSTALSIAEDGTVTIKQPIDHDAEVKLIATVNYGITSSYALAYEFTIPAIEKVLVDFGNSETEYTFTAKEATGNYTITEGETLVSEYDITVLDGETEISNPGEVTVKLLIPEAYRNNKENLKVYHINAEKEAEEMDVSVDGDYLVFTATEFSPYVIVLDQRHTVKYVDYDGTELLNKKYYGEEPAAPANPTREADETYTYVFKEWTKEVEGTVTTYTATYTLTYIEYTVKYLDHDGTELLNETYHYGEEPAAPVNPTREADETYTYVFKEWTKEVEGTVTTYTATYTLTYIEYTVTFKFENGSDDDVKTYHYGDEIVVPENPTKEADDEYTYTFIGWDEEVAETVTKTVTYTAQYEMNPIVTEPQEEVIVARFNFGENGTATHHDGSDLTKEDSYSSDSYDLNFTSSSKVYKDARDAFGNSCLKLGTSSAVGSFTVAVPENVTKVIIYVAGYKANAAKISINGDNANAQTISTLSNDGEYTAVEIDTSTNKTISFATVTGGYRCMINKIEYCGLLKDGENALDPEVEKFVVVFDTEDEMVYYAKDEYVYAPNPDPVKEGYTFSYWCVDGVEVEFPYQVTGNVTFAAKWDPNTYNVSFDDGVNIVTLPQTFDSIMSFPEDPVSVDEMKEFAGWYTEEEGKGEKYSQGDMFTKVEDLTLYAYWQDKASDDPTTNVKKFVKVTTAPTDWSGTYLIVYEAEKMIFDGSLTTLDAANNYSTVTITDNAIEYADELEEMSFTIEKSENAYNVKSASGFYIGSTSNTNVLSSSKDTKYTNSISLENDGSVKIVSSAGSVLRFNTTSGQDRFRYFKSGTYTSQKAISLYKLIDE